MQGFAFKLYPPGSMGYSDVSFCQGSNEPDVSTLRAIPSETKVLFVMGAQKAGTTWLFNALEAHSSFIGADHSYMCAINQQVLCHVAYACVLLNCADTTR